MEGLPSARHTWHVNKVIIIIIINIIIIIIIVYVFIFEQTLSILNSLHPTVHCGHGIHYSCKSTFFELRVYSYCHSQ